MDKWRGKAMTHEDKNVRLRYEELEAVWGATSPKLCTAAVFHAACYNAIVNRRGRSVCCIGTCRAGLPPCTLPRTGEVSSVPMPWPGATPECLFRTGRPEGKGVNSSQSGGAAANPRFRGKDQDSDEEEGEMSSSGVGAAAVEPPLAAAAASIIMGQMEGVEESEGGGSTVVATGDQGSSK